jgi:hypothetical protein
MDYQMFVKKLSLPSGFTPPHALMHENLKARPLTRQDLAADLEAVNSSIAIIQKTRGGSWPAEQLSEEFDLLDLAWHEREFRDGSSFAYVVYDTNDKYIGCFYLYPVGVRAALTKELLQYDVDASWWVTAEAYEQGYYEKLYAGLQRWLASEFPFKNVYYSNRELPNEEA